MTRQTGKTTAAILRAPVNSIYICATFSHLNYIVDLTRHLGRTDLRVMYLDNFLHNYRRGVPVPPAVVDHTVWETAMNWQMDTLERLGVKAN